MKHKHRWQYVEQNEIKIGNPLRFAREFIFVCECGMMKIVQEKEKKGEIK